MIGAKLGPYRLDAHLGSGAMGTVYLADLRGETVAVKILHPHLLERPGIFKRFQQEALAGRRVRHPNVVRTLDCDMVVADRVPLCYLVMEYVEGRTLRILLDELGFFREGLLVEVARQIGSGLEAIHSEGFVHRDLKPENIQISREEQVKLMDFGVARLGEEGFVRTVTEKFIGTIRYAAPEQLSNDGSAPDARTDLFSLGVMLHEAAIGRHPFPGDDVHEVVRSILETEPPRLRELRPDLSPVLDRIVHRLLQKERGARFSSASELLAALQSGAEGSGVGEIGQAPPVPVLRRPPVPRETALHGRREEIERLLRIFGEVAGGEGRGVLIEGAMGVGKTRLVDEFIARLEAKGENFDLLFGSYPPGGAAGGVEAFARAFGDRLEEEGFEAALDRLMPGSRTLARSFASVLRSEPPPAGSELLSRESLYTAFGQALRGLAADRPVVLFIDDLQFAPPDGLSAFASLVFGLPRHRVMLIGTAREELPEKWRGEIARLEHVTPLRIGRLSATAVERLLEDALASPNVAAKLGRGIAARADGNPFFVFEILRDLKETGVLVRGKAGGWTTSGKKIAGTVPLAITHLMEARLSQLTEEDRGLLEVAACCGHEFDPIVVAEALDLSRIKALHQLGRIERDHRVIRAQGRRFSFDHHLVRETLVGGLSDSLREAYHVLIAETIERSGRAQIDGAAAAEICEHYLDGNRPDVAREHLERALGHLEKTYHNERAILLLERVLAVPGLTEDAERVDLLIRAGSLLELTAGHDRARSAFSEAIELAASLHDPLRGARARVMLGGLLSNLGELDEARSGLEEAVDLAVAAGDLDMEGKARGYLGNALAWSGRPDEARECYERSLALAARIGNTKAEAGAITNLAILAWEQGDLPVAREGFERSLETFRKTGDRRAEATTIGLLGHVLDDLGRFEESAEHHRTHLKLSREIGYRRGEAIATSNLGEALRRQGRLDDARIHFERSREISEEIGDRPGVVSALINFAAIDRRLGRNRSVTRALRTAYRECRETGVPRDRVLCLNGLATAQLELGHPARARVLAEKSIEIAREIRFAAEEIWGLLTLGRVRLALGQPEEARRSIERAVELGWEKDLPSPSVLGTCHLALLGAVDVQRACARRRELGERLESHERIEADFLLYRAGAGREYLESSRAELIEFEAQLTEADLEELRKGVALYREIYDTWEKHG